MTKVVYNACYGGFSLSDKAIRRYAELKGLTLYLDESSSSLVKTYWTIPPEELPNPDHPAYNKAYAKYTLCSYDNFERHDPILVQVVEELGDEAGGVCARLAIEEVQSGTAYRIDEYDGLESVMTNEDYDWTIAP